MSRNDRIQQLLAEKPGLKAQEIASELGLERAEVAAALHRLSPGEFAQDSAYRWWPRPGAPAGAPAPEGLLPRLCRYYLDCLTRESGSGVSLPVEAAGIEYVALAEFPLAHPMSGAVQDRTIRRLIRRIRQERGRLDLFLGYALRVRPAPSRDDSAMRVEPILIYGMEDSADCPLELLRPEGGVPRFNLDVLKTLLAVDSGSALDEATQLVEELGLANEEGELPHWDEIVLRLQQRRPDWPWREDLNPYRLSSGDMVEPGIYNRAILFAGPRSPYTYGLEIELSKLAQLEEEAVAASALGAWVRGAMAESGPVEDRAILELLPLNAEQRQVVVQGLSAPLTVVTGPPGTGKSQVVVALMANMARQGRSVLFASKNNHAVEVVESRANALASYPLVLRLGREEHHSQLAQHLSSLLAHAVDARDLKDCGELERLHGQTQERYAEIGRRISATVELRNRVDELERSVEPARERFGRAWFLMSCATDPAPLRERLDALGAALEAARAPGMLQSRRLKRVADAASELEGTFGLYVRNEDFAGFHRTFAEVLDQATRVYEYWQAFARLRDARPLEDLAREWNRITEGLPSAELWRKWMETRPARWTRPQRQLLSEYASLLQMVASGEHADEGSGKRVLRRFYRIFPEVLPVLPCWAVTSLSARGRLPFDSGLFDLVIIDEASQCDIASALPLLLRARRAVIIGDPLQLKHVSAVPPQLDRLLLAANGLAEGSAVWAYSVNSLFDLARSLCRQEDIVNLRDHHRSHRDIIEFSNRHFYRGGLRVATDHDGLRRPAADGPAARWVDVQGKVVRPPRGGAMNVPEAEAVITELRRLVLDQGYAGSVGVVTPFRAQANRIRALAQRDIELAAVLGARDFVVDTVHGFQGDERDVMVFSPVVSRGIGETTLRFLKSHGNLFNVAITRARSGLIVVGDRQAALDSEVGYLAAFAEHVQGLAGPEKAAPVEVVVSEWERVLFDRLVAAGLQPVPQYKEAPYTLDLALFDGDRKLDIEVDGEQYHRNWDGQVCLRDQIRSRYLADRGWDVMRFWVYELRDDIVAAVARAQTWMRG
jgi:very-short-patch-repair endonuclease